MILPGAYSLTSGNVTFQLTVPDMTRTSLHSVTITVPDLFVYPAGSNSNILSQKSSLDIQRYHRYSQRWHMIALTSDTFMTITPEQYAGPDGRMLVQVRRNDLSQIYFGRPSLKLNDNSN
jgi:hypothetical protein